MTDESAETGSAAGPRTLLLVDDEENILSALKRVLRHSGYRILTATDGQTGLDLLERHDIGVIVSDQRMPGMSGVEFLSRAREVRPETMRIVLSGYTDLDSIADAINRGAVYRFVTKPWDDELLHASIEEAFQRHEMKRENARLTRSLAEANAKLTALNRDLTQVARRRTGEAARTLHLLHVAQDILEAFPMPVLGLDDEGLIVLANRRASERLAGGLPLTGDYAADRLPDDLLDCCRRAQRSRGVESGLVAPADGGATLHVYCYPLGDRRGDEERGVAALLYDPEAYPEGER